MRSLPLASDRDRISAARYAALKLRNRWQDAQVRRRKRLWDHWIDSKAGIISEKRP